ncbi:MAG: zf-HC2 domain-containing protein [Desertimonas sp.]
MADCEETLRELEAFLDDELAPETRSIIHAHLEGCPDCYGAFDFHAELKQVISVKCRDEAMPPGLMSKIQACFGPEPGEPAG